MERENPVLVAIRNEKGLAAKLGKKLGITREAVWMWHRVPPKHAVRVARFMKMPIQAVCPELYGKPRTARKLSNSVRN